MRWKRKCQLVRGHQFDHVMRRFELGQGELQPVAFCFTADTVETSHLIKVGVLSVAAGRVIIVMEGTDIEEGIAGWGQRAGEALRARCLFDVCAVFGDGAGKIALDGERQDASELDGAAAVVAIWEHAHRLRRRRKERRDDRSL